VDAVASLTTWFSQQLDDIRCHEDTKAYVVNLLSRFKPEDELADRSVVVAYAAAKQSGDFSSFQRIGDWVLWAEAIQPGLVSLERHVVSSIGRLSYYACHRIMRGQWRLYEELADELLPIAADVRRKLAKQLSPSSCHGSWRFQGLL